MSKPAWDTENGINGYIKSAWQRLKYWWKTKVVGSSIYNKVTGDSLTGAEREANAFSAEQAQLERDWQEEMYLKYNSPSALMSQYREAGLNPALMYGQNVAGNMSANASAPSSVTPDSGSSLANIVDIIGLKSQIDLNKANARLANSNADVQDTEAKWRDTLLGLKAKGDELSNNLTSEQIKEVASKILKNNADSLLAEAQTENEGLKKFVYRADARLKDAMRSHEEESAKQIAKLTPYLAELYDKQGTNQEAQAAAAFAKAAIDNGLLEAGYVQEYVNSIAASANLDISQTKLNDFVNGLQRGEFFDDEAFGGKFMNSFVQGLSMLAKLFPKLM